MNEILIKAPAKINLYLDILGKRPDGYHDLKMIMQTVSLYDEISLKKIDTTIELSSDAPMPTGEKNTAYKAAKLMIDTFGIKSGVKIEIKKKIPMGAGLAGGSTDAAGVIKGMNEMFELGQNQEELAKLGKKVGADVPFCVIGGTAIAEGIGEQITVLDKFNDVDIVMVKPDFSASTAYIFGKYCGDDLREKPGIEKLIESMRNRDIKEVGKYLYNALETVTAIEYDEIDKIKSKLLELGAQGPLMSGSGSTVYGLFQCRQEAEFAVEELSQKYKQLFLVKTI